MKSVSVNGSLSINQIDENTCLVNAASDYKVISCDVAILKEFLKKSQGKNMKEIVALFSDRFSKDEIVNFTEILLKENIVSFVDASVKHKKSNISVIFKGNLYNQIRSKLSGVVEEIPADKYNNEDLLGDLVLVALDGITYKEMLDLNSVLYKKSKPYLYIFHNGKGVTCGPFVIPGKTACCECILSHRIKVLQKNTYKQIKISDFMDIMVSDLLDTQNFSESFYWNIARIIQCEVMKIGKEGEVYDFVGKEYLYTNEKWNYDSMKKFVPISECNCCHGHNKDYISLKDKNLSDLFSTYKKSSGKNIQYSVGGLRSLSPEQTKKIVDSALKKSGLAIRIEAIEENPFKDIISVYDSHLDPVHVNQTPYLLHSQWSHGKGITKEQAYFSAAFEIFERISARYFGEKSVVLAKYKEVKGNCIDLEKIVGNIENHNTEFDKLTDETEIDWVVGTSLSKNEPILMPASMTFLSSTHFKGNFTPASSSGLAAGGTLEDAILQGVYEIIEHDAWMIGQANPVKLPLIDIGTSKNERLKNKISEIKEMGYQVAVRDYTGEFKLPVFRTWIVSPDDFTNYAFNGLGAAYDPEIALERSITEAVQSANKRGVVKTKNYKKPSAGYMMNDPNSIYNLSYFVKKDMEISKNEKTISLDMYRTTPLSSVQDILNATLERLKKVDSSIDIAYYELTRQSIGIPVVRVMITPSVQMLATPLTVVSPRMYTFQKNMGYSNEVPSYKDLYMGIYPH